MQKNTHSSRVMIRPHQLGAVKKAAPVQTRSKHAIMRRARKMGSSSAARPAAEMMKVPVSQELNGSVSSPSSAMSKM